MKLIALIFTLPLLSCVNTKQVATAQEPTHLQETSDQDNDVVVINNLANVNITITHYTPYCGGEAPTQDVLDRCTYAVTNQFYNLIDLNSMKKTKVKTDSLGVLKLHLDSGSYAIQELFKDCSYDEFKKQANPLTGMYTMDLGEDCYKKWWKSYLGAFTVSSLQDIKQLQMRERDNCFTGNNPCIMYTGPYPP